MASIEAVTLDLWQTLVVDTREWGRLRTQIRIDDTVAALQEVGEQVTEEQVREAFRAGYREGRSIREQGLELTFREQVETFVTGISEGIMDRISGETFTHILNRYSDAFYDSPPMLPEGIPEMLLSLRTAGYKVGLISNTGMTPGQLFRAYFKEHGIADFFDYMTFSDEVGMSKPASPIFFHTFASMGCNAANTVHVGDHKKNDIAGASEIGMRTVWLQGFDESDVEVNPTTVIENILDLPQALKRLESG